MGNTASTSSSSSLSSSTKNSLSNASPSLSRADSTIAIAIATAAAAAAAAAEIYDDNQEAILRDAISQQFLQSRRYRIDAPLIPGSGRMMRTYRIRASIDGNNNNNTNNNSNATVSTSTTAGMAADAAVSQHAAPTAVVKAMWWIEDNATTNSAATAGSGPTITNWDILREQAKELERIREALAENNGAAASHVAPFATWWLGDQARVLSNTLRARPLCLVRPYVYTTVADRLASRPWLHTVEKVFLLKQLLEAVQQLHDAGVVHGCITTENLGLTSSGWLVLLDIASYKAFTALPDDDPSLYLYYFERRGEHRTSIDPAASEKKAKSIAAAQRQGRCYLAPERFYTPSSSSSASNTNKIASHDESTTSIVKTAASASTSANTLGEAQKNSSVFSPSSCLTPAMDLFSAGCVMVEVFLNGERCFDLGELLEYKRQGSLTPILKQRLDKIESSAWRAACRHMLHTNPNDRLSRAKDYLHRLFKDEEGEGQKQPGEQKDQEEKKTATRKNSSHSLELLGKLIERMTVQNRMNTKSPDARLAVCAAHYPLVLWETVGQEDPAGTAYLKKVLGNDAIVMPPHMLGSPPCEGQALHGEPSTGQGGKAESDGSDQPNVVTSSSRIIDRSEALFAETENLLKQLDSLNIDDLDDILNSKGDAKASSETSAIKNQEKDIQTSPAKTKAIAHRSATSKSSLLIYLQLVLSLVRHVQRPASKMVALQLMHRLAIYSSDEARLQRIVPFTVSLLQDQDALVRAYALRVVTKTLALVESFSPSDAQVFPQYIFKRVAHLISDPSLCVRLAFAECLAVLAETAHLFLDISHAVRLYEAVGSGGTASVSTSSAITHNGNPSSRNATKESKSSLPSKVRSDDTNIFGDDVARLLDNTPNSPKRDGKTDPDSVMSRSSSMTDLARIAAGKTLISSSYQAELAGLQETVSRWVVQITTDQADNSALSKRAMLGDLSRLCEFFGLEGVMSSVLPLILAFLNERKNWELRSSLLEALPAVCQTLGRAATEEFVVPCVEIGLVDEEEQVISKALFCLSRLLEMSLLSRSFLLGGVGNSKSGRTNRPNESSILQRYGALLIHPAEIVRSEAISTFSTAYSAVGSPDAEVYILPVLQPFLRYPPSPGVLGSPSGMERCLRPPWSHQRFATLQEKCLIDRAASAADGTWTSVGALQRKGAEVVDGQTANQKGEFSEERRDDLGKDSQFECVLDYVRMLVRHTGKSPLTKESSKFSILKDALSSGIEGSAKLAQSVMFPRQDSSTQKGTIPEWYSVLRDAAEREDSIVSETAAIQSVSALGHVYGLSIIGPLEGTTENIVGAADDSKEKEEMLDHVLRKAESKALELACTGEWGSEAQVEPDVVDTLLLLAKLKALEVPPLPPDLGEKSTQKPISTPQTHGSAKGGTTGTDWKPRVNSLVASSSPAIGHTAAVVRLAVSLDNTFFVSGSHDGTCRVWETSQLDESNGSLESSLVYSGHSAHRPARVNDIALVERSHSVVSGDSNGVVSVWRVDTVASAARSSAIGTSDLRKVDPSEGEILAVSHFNSPSASIITFATQKGLVHSWDLRSAREPFVLRHGPELGHLTAVALGSDRQWIVTGTNRGYLSLWDIRFQKAVKLWRHSRMAPINRLATSEVAPPQTWGTRIATTNIQPFIFAATGPNECGMFDVITGSCRECFRTVAGDSRELHAHVEEPPELHDIAISMKSSFGLGPSKKPFIFNDTTHLPAAINCMGGSIGGSNQSYLITGGSDCRIRFWDFSTPSKCYVVCGPPSYTQQQPKASFERIDFEGNKRVMLCRQPRVSHGFHEHLNNPRWGSSGSGGNFQGLKKPDHSHFKDSIQDVKILEGAFVGCSRDGAVKVFR